MSEPIQPTSKKDTTMYLGMDREELREIIGDRDSEIELLQEKLKRYEPINTYDGRDIESWRSEALRLRAALERLERQLRGYAEFSPADELHRIVVEALSGSSSAPETGALHPTTEADKLLGAAEITIRLCKGSCSKDIQRRIKAYLHAKFPGHIVSSSSEETSVSNPRAAEGDRTCAVGGAVLPGQPVFVDAARGSGPSENGKGDSNG